MKKFLLIVSLMIANAVHASDMLGLLNQVVISGSLNTYMNAPFLITKMMYTIGGITFTFPTGLFPQDPYIFIGFNYTGANLGFLSHYTYSAYNKSVNGVTIKVYDGLGLEIGSNLVEVYIFATCQDPDSLSILVN